MCHDPACMEETRRAKVGSVPRVPATDIEEVVVKSLNGHLRGQSGATGAAGAAVRDRDKIAELTNRIDVHKDRLTIRLKSREGRGVTTLADDVEQAQLPEEPTEDRLLSIPWQKPPSKRCREMLMPHGTSRKDVRPERPERRLRLVTAIARGRRWLDEIISGSVPSAEQIASRERCSVRHVNMTISLAFLAPKLVSAAVEGRLARGINIERLRMRRRNGASSSKHSA